MMYDLLVVGSGLYGAVVAQQAKERGLRVLVLERRKEIGGNIRDEWQGDICVHRYGAHIFHTDNAEVWRYVNRFARFVPYRHEVLSRSGDRLYHLPFSMTTMNEVFGVRTTWDTGYFDDRYQGIPEQGYSSMIEKMLGGRLGLCRYMDMDDAVEAGCAFVRV